MKKILICIVVIILVFVAAFIVGNKLYYNMVKVDKDRENIEIPEQKENENVVDTSYIKESKEMNTRGLFDLGDGVTTYEIDLMANDMTWNAEPRLYHKIITTMEDYNIYNERIGLPKMTETDFEENFIVVVANENVRESYETDLYIAEVVVEDNTSHIILKQRENPREYCDNNVFYAVIDNDMLKENIVVEIQN